MALIEIREAARSLNVKPGALRMAIKNERIVVAGRGKRGVALFNQSEVARYALARKEAKSRPQK